MAEIDSLQIQIGADTSKASKSIQSLSTALSNLDKQLGSFRNLGAFSTAMNGLATTINDFSTSISSIDVTKIQSVADAMKKISSASKGMGGATKSMSFTQVESEAQGFKKAIDDLTADITRNFGISKKDADGLRERITALAQSVNAITTNKDASKSGSLFEDMIAQQNELKGFVDRNSRITEVWGSDYQNVVNEIKSANRKLLVDTTTVANEVGQRYNDLRNTLGKGFAQDTSRSMGFDSWIKANFDPGMMEVVNAEIQKLGGTVGSSASQFEALASIFNRYNTQIRQGYAEVSMLNSSQEGLQSTVAGATSAFEQLSLAEGRVATIGQTQTVNAFHSMADGLKQFESISINNVGQITELANAIKSLGYATSTQAVANMPKLTVELNKMISTLAKAPTVSKGVTELVTALAAFNNSMRSYNGTARSTRASNGILSNSFLNLNKGVNKAHTGFKGLASTIGKIYATYWLFFRLFSKLGEAIDLSSQLTEVENVVNQTFGNMRKLVDNFASNSITKFGMSELALKKYSSRFQAMGTAMGITGDQLKATTGILGDAENQYGKLTGSMAEMSVNLTKLTADMASFYDVEQSAVAEDLYSVFTGQTRSLRQYGIDLTEVNLKEWAMKQGLYANTKAMTQAQKAALRYAYTLDAAKYAMGDFERTSDTWANQLRILKANLQQLAIVIGQGFINALKPLVRGLNAALQAITSFATKVLNALGQIFGWHYEINLGGVTTELDDAAGAADDLDSGLGGAAKNAKELKNQLRGFDKLNVLTTDDDGKGSGSGGGGGGAAEMSDLINAAQTGIGLFQSSIKDLESLGAYISNTISGVLEGINWEDVYEKARNFGTGLAQFMNGQFAGEAGKRLFSDVGITIAGALNTVGEAINSYASEFKWDEFGQNLATGINSFFKNWKPVLLATSFYKMADGILTAIINALDTVDWELVGEKIGQFLSSLKFEKIVKKMAVALGKAISGIFTVIKFSFKEAPIETALLTAFAAIKFTKIGSAIAGLMLTKLFGKEGMITLAIKGVLISVKDSVKWQGKTLIAILQNAISSSLGVTVPTLMAEVGALVAPVALMLSLAVVFEAVAAAQSKSNLREALGGNEWDIVKEKIEGTATAIESTTEAIGNLKVEYDNALSTAENEGETIRNLADRYFELSEKTNLTEKEKEQLKTVSEALVGLMPELSSAYDSQTGYINLEREAIEKLTEAQIESAKKNAQLEMLTDLYKQQYVAVDEMKAAYDEYNQVAETTKQKLLDLRSGLGKLPLQEGYISWSDYQKGVAEANAALADAHASFESAVDNVNSLGTSINDLTGQTDGITAYSAALESGGENARDMANDILFMMTVTDNSAENAKLNSQKVSDNVGKAKTSVSKDLGDTKVKADDLTKAVNDLKTESDMSGATSNFATFSSTTNANLQSTERNTDNVFDAVGDLKRQSDMSGASSNIKSFTNITDTGMQGTKRNIDSTKTSTDNLKTSTKDLLTYNNKTLTINKDENAFKSLGEALSGFLTTLGSIFAYNNKTLTINQQTNTSGGSSSGGKTKKEANGGVFKNGKWHDIAKFAAGGYPTTGQVFIAREAGAELVGNLGGGTGVMNNDQIVASVSNGVYQAVASAMRQYGGTNVNVMLEGDANGLFRAVQTESQRYSNRTGRPAFPT